MKLSLHEWQIHLIFSINSSVFLIFVLKESLISPSIIAWYTRQFMTSSICFGIVGPSIWRCVYNCKIVLVSWLSEDSMMALCSNQFWLLWFAVLLFKILAQTHQAIVCFHFLDRLFAMEWLTGCGFLSSQVCFLGMIVSTRIFTAVCISLRVNWGYLAIILL